LRIPDASNALFCRALRPAAASALAALAAACSQPLQPSAFTEVSIEQLRADPASWIGRPVEVEGVVNAEADRSSSLNENCSSGAKSVLVRWDNVPGFHPDDAGANVRVRGVFDLGEGVERHATLHNVSILWRLPPNLPHCRS
jgi:hypothetical protein